MEEQKGLVERCVPDADPGSGIESEESVFKFQIFVPPQNRWLHLFELKYTVVSFSSFVSL